MGNTWFSRWREQDDLEAFANLYARQGVQLTTIAVACFAGSLIICMAMFYVALDRHMGLMAIAAPLASAFIEMAAFAAGGYAVACLAHSTRRRIGAMESQIAELQKRAGITPPKPIAPPQPGLRPLTPMGSDGN